MAVEDPNEVIVEIPQDGGPDSAVKWGSEQPPKMLTQSEVGEAIDAGTPLIFTPDPDTYTGTPR